VQERLQKLLAASGVASRRSCEALILAGRVTVNGRVTRELGTRADPDADDVRLDGRPVRPPATQSYFMQHKPRGYTSTAADTHAANTVMELLPEGAGRVFPVGRLDRESEGLLLLTDDGELAERLLHPRYHVPKEYAVMVRGRITQQALERLRGGVPVEGRRTAPAEVEPGEPPPGVGAPGGHDLVWLHVVLHEGRKRQIREMCAYVGLEVVRLVRVKLGPLNLGTLRPGAVRPLTAVEIAHLRKACGLPPPLAAEVEDIAKRAVTPSHRAPFRGPPRRTETERKRRPGAKARNAPAQSGRQQPPTERGPRARPRRPARRASAG
jgi:23S rRNA pseudouridine2605 synthase